jgi:serine/threonine protein kinase
LIPGQRVDSRYRLLKRIGSGALGTVWSARNETTEREVAVKLIEPTWSTPAANVERFLEVAKQSGKIKHPSVVQLFDIGKTSEGTPFVVMELLEAEKLDDHLARMGPLPPGIALRLVGELAAALISAHASGIFHHRIEPANVLLSRDLRGDVVPKLIDFGIVRLVDDLPPDEGGTRDGALGPVNYLAPEQVDPLGKPDARTDIWSLGVLLQHCLTGEPPYEATTRPALIDEIDAGSTKLVAFEPPIDDKIIHLVSDCLSIDPGLRPTARVLAERAQALVARMPGQLADLGETLKTRTDLLPDEDPPAVEDVKGTSEDAMPLLRPSGRRSNAPPAGESDDDLAPISKLIATRLSHAPGELALDVLAELEEELLKKVNESRAAAEKTGSSRPPPPDAPTAAERTANEPTALPTPQRPRDEGESRAGDARSNERDGALKTGPMRAVRAEPAAPASNGAGWLIVLLVLAAFAVAALLWKGGGDAPAAAPSSSATVPPAPSAAAPAGS